MKYQIVFPNEEYSDFSILEQNEKSSKLYRRVNKTTDFYGDYDVGIQFSPNEYYSGTQRFENEVLNFKFKKFNFGSIGFFGITKTLQI